jgi:hypothetical protein
MTARKTIRILGLFLMAATLLLFATIVVSHWHSDNSVNDSACPYCHAGEQMAAKLETFQWIAVLQRAASLPLPEDSVLANGPVFSLTSPRAPPAA